MLYTFGQRESSTTCIWQVVLDLVVLFCLEMRDANDCNDISRYNDQGKKAQNCEIPAISIITLNKVLFEQFLR